MLVPHSWIFCEPGCLGGNEDPSTLVSDSRFLQASGHPFALKEAFFLPGIFQAFKLLGMVGLGRWGVFFRLAFSALKRTESLLNPFDSHHFPCSNPASPAKKRRFVDV